MKKAIKKAIVLAASIIALSGTAFAGSSTSNMNISTEVEASCVLDFPASVSFNYDPKLANEEALTFYVQCTKGTPYNMSLSAGKSGVETARALENSFGEKLSYKISAMDGMDWGSGANSMSDVGYGTRFENTVFLRTSVNEYVRPGIYTDELTVTMTY